MESRGGLPDAGRMTYRPEIDGLRALAVGGVLAHHAFPGALPGGFVGVDVFFVISGYLITGIIAADMAEGRFSQWRFLERRVRRIVPALAAMLLVTGPAAWAILTPEDFKPFSQSLTAAAVFGSNLLFAREADYFDSVEGMTPLLHTWTLGVEEQFYLIFPLILLGCHRWHRGAMLPVVIALGLASFALALVLAERWPLGAFYLLPTRLWEFALGAACALWAARPGPRGGAALAGLALLAAGFAVIGPGAAMPGALFVLPTLGTALVILFAGPATLAGRMLAAPPLAWLGTVSFGTYLWHQPLLALARYVWLGPLPLAAVLGLVALSIGLGAASYRWIEQPIRQRRLLASNARLLLVCGAALVLVAAAGVAGHLRVLLPASAAEAARLGGLRPLTAREIITPGTDALPFIVYGDSHAIAYHAALGERLAPGALLSHPSCLAAPGLSNQFPADPAGASCRAMPQRLARLARERRAGVIVWAQLWDRTVFAGASPEVLSPDERSGTDAVVRGVEQMAAAMPPGTRIVLIGNTPTAWAAGPAMGGGWLRCRAYRNAACPADYPAAKARGRAINAALSALAARDPRFAYIDAQAPLCPDGRCRIIQDGQLNYWDSNHLTAIAARRVIGTIEPRLLMR